MKASRMLDTALAAPCTRAAPRKPKKAASGSKACEAAAPNVTELVTRAMSTPKERKELSLGTLRKARAAGGYNEEKNKSHIKLGPKSLLSNGTLAQTKGIGASGSFKLNKKLETKEKATETKEKATEKKTAAKPKKPAAKKPAGPAKKPKKVVMVKKRPKKAKKPAAPAAKKAAKSLKGATGAGHTKEAAKSPAKAEVVKPKAAKPKPVKPKVAKAKKAVPKKK